MKVEEFDIENLVNNPHCVDDYSKTMGMMFTSLGDGEATAVLTIKPWQVNPLGSVHGGVLFSLADITAGTAAVAGGVKVTTLDAQMSFLAPALLERTKTLTAVAKRIKAGKTIQVLEVEVWDEEKRLICKASYTFFVMKA
ncbi:MAG: PaaI family thioesterase [Lachnospiraceae bacterium]|nr:PaaI family thioesterase [Lachnospiraceae bacterium]